MILVLYENTVALVWTNNCYDMAVNFVWSLFIFICRMNDIFNLAGIIERINIKKKVQNWKQEQEEKKKKRTIELL